MLNEKKIRWMTRASIYEKHEGRIDFKRNNYFLSDYVRTHLLQNLICVTIAFVLIAGIYALCNVETIFVLISNMQIMILLKKALLMYIILVVIYTGIGIILYSWKYQKSRKRVRQYYRMLKLVEKFGQEEKK